MKKITFKTIFHFSICSILINMACTGNTNIKPNCNIISEFEDGLYYGVDGMTALRTVFVTKSSKNVLVEFFLPIKGQIVKLYEEILVFEKGSSGAAEYHGKNIRIICDKNFLVIKSKKDMIHITGNHGEGDWDFKFDEIHISSNPGKEQKLNECRNKALLYDDYMDINNFFRDTKIFKEQQMKGISRYEELRYKYCVDKMALTIPHDEFVKKFKVIKKQIMEQIMSEMKDNEK